ncbi:hypothetical protein AEYBE204_13135 [Asticcacaulis sp. YBE204]|nr:hypothetical protein AEYBE204_13135 [Asticcacaulis sp. YBE204]
MPTLRGRGTLNQAELFPGERITYTAKYDLVRIDAARHKIMSPVAGKYF